MPKGKKLKLKTMQDEVLDRLDHMETVLEDHANCGIRNDAQIAAMEEAICPKVAARLASLERGHQHLTERVEMFAKHPGTLAEVAVKTPWRLIRALRMQLGIEFTADGISKLREVIAQHG